MKIFSSFDTKFKQHIIEREQKKHWKENIKVVSHGKVYYNLFVIFPSFFIVFWIVLYLVILFLLWWSISTDFKSLYYIVWLVVFLLLFIPLIVKILKKYIDYILDFLVVNSHNIIYYNQEWILNRKWKTIDNEKVKTITVEKKWLLKSIFNFWNIVILTEWTSWNEEWEWEIKFSFLDEPDNVKHDIFNIINPVEKKIKIE